MNRTRPATGGGTTRGTAERPAAHAPRRAAGLARSAARAATGLAPNALTSLGKLVLNALTGLVELVLNAVTGLAALALLLLAGLSTALTPVIGARAAAPLALARRLATFHRRRAGPDPRGPAPTTRRTLLWLAVHSVTGPAPLVATGAMLTALDYVFFRLHPLERSSLNTFAMSLSIAAIAVVILMSVSMFRTGQARLSRLLLDPRPAPDARIRELTESRAAVVDARAAELRRIERDLHDGAQAKLIAIRMHLGLARGCRDPGELLRVMDEARQVAGEALTDLRDLVRGIHPPVLSDRGLAGAIEASALLCPVPVTLDLDLRERLQPPVESAVYFAAAEALTNVTKHSGASRAWVRLRHRAGVLSLTVGDDGHGGARRDAGTGLRGIENRLSAFDGSLTVSSPPCGPTELIMELPCA
ncbi:sensor histidine kinase [Nonomuraea rubra]|uniref:histidine kinase n=1 Tax=Nonomuraea rubra TaxID=46180 RepID=A0A7X0NTF3_9ACTN|nr:histidine kinase [Nonomuraea rubra]MBB6549309.1 signal transduction histidine kinase [Nonomuraea rubra]